MARDIPLDQALTDQDRRYLRDRGAWGQALETRVDENYPPDPAQLEAFNAREKADSVTAPGDRMLLEENARLKEQLAALQAGQEPTEAPAEEDDRAYEEWTLAELQAEIRARNEERVAAGGTPLPTSGTKADLAARLNEDDASA